MTIGIITFQIEILLLEKIKTLSRELENNSEIIEKINSARDNLYAHKNPGKIISYVHWSELELMSTLSANTYDQLHGGLFGTNTIFSATGDWSVKDMLESFARYRIIIRNQRR